MNAIQFESIIEETKKLIENFDKELKQLESHVTECLNSLMKRYSPALELLKSKLKGKADSFNISYLNDLNNERKKIIYIKV